MIWSRLRTDILFLYVPGILAILISHLIPENEESVVFLFFAFIAAGFLDSGHVYATVWRTYFRPTERKRTRLYWALPIFFFALFFMWNYFEWKYLAAFVVYATVYHNVRQLLGISRWYQKLNRAWSKTSDIFLYLLCFWPFLIYHFRDTATATHYYGTDELFAFPSDQLLNASISIYFIIVASWLGFELYRNRAVKDFNRTLSVFFAGVFYGAAFLLSETAVQVLFPLVVSHGFSYLALTDFSLRKIEPRRYSGLKPTLFILGTALVFGGAEFVLEGDWQKLGSASQAFTTALFLTPLFCHYYFDAFLWKRTHPDAPLIYAS